MTESSLHPIEYVATAYLIAWLMPQASVVQLAIVCPLAH